MHIQYITRRGSADTVLLVLLDGTFWETLHDLVDVSWPEMEQYLPADDRWTMVISCGNARRSVLALSALPSWLQL